MSEAAAPDGLLQARRDLRARQGLGARYDAPSAPARELDWARRGTAYFARQLNALSDAELALPSAVPGWTRRHVAVCVGYHARAMARVVERARTGSDLTMFARPGQREEEIANGATLPAGALRHLVTHADIHLNVEWRDLADADWDRPLHLPEGAETARETPWIRAREVWLRAVDLGNGGSLRDLPADFLNAVVAERVHHLAAARPALSLDFHPDTGSLALSGRPLDAPLPMIARWLLGHEAEALRSALDLPDLTAPRR